MNGHHAASTRSADPHSSALLAGRTALVTGAGRGNGCAIAIGLARAGATVCVSDVDLPSAQATTEEILASGGQAFAVRWNIADPQDTSVALAAIRAAAPPVSILVNNAGIEASDDIGAAEFASTWRRVLDVNLDGTMRVTHALVPDLAASRGCIVNVVSIQSYIAYQPHAAAYSTSKAAIAQFTRALAVELAPAGVRVNAIAPGFMDTPMTAGSKANPAAMAYMMSRTPMKRFGSPDELVGPVLFLVSDMATYVTGAVVPVDGGLLAN